LIANGVKADIPGNIEYTAINNVLTLRNYGDILKIKQTIPSAHKIIIAGASFIGMELASLIRKNYKKVEITIIDENDVPFESILGKEIGKAIQT
jgi:NADPH-dependent 2,4-dienoyl-CoA reductase/sulfur reductase-like enzyme